LEASHPPSFLCFSFSFSFSLTVPTDQGRNFENALGGLATFFSAESLNICLKLRLYKKALKMTDYQLFLFAYYKACLHSETILAPTSLILTVHHSYSQSRYFPKLLEEFQQKLSITGLPFFLFKR
jgi:hypothetical protein